MEKQLKELHMKKLSLILLSVLLSAGLVYGDGIRLHQSSNSAAVGLNTTHRTSDGTDHTYIDQDVTSGTSPTFDGANVTGVDADNVDIADVGVIITATEVEGALQENRTAIDLNTAKDTNVPVSADPIWTAAGELVIGTGAGTAQKLAAGATTEILVGGGAADPVWTTATGTGAPVRAGSPTFTTQITTPIIALTGGQIAFPATAVPSSDPNTLDDYEEGTWTPVLGGKDGTSGQAYFSQYGDYIKIGSSVTINFHIYIQTKGTITGELQIQGQPFTSTQYAACAFGYPEKFNLTAGHVLVGHTQSGKPIKLYEVEYTNDTPSALSAGSIVNSSRITGAMAYSVMP